MLIYPGMLPLLFGNERLINYDVAREPQLKQTNIYLYMAVVHLIKKYLADFTTS